MKLKYHTAISIILSGILYAIFKSWGLAIASFISGIFIDLDHIIDYLHEYGLPLNVREFSRVCYEKQFRQVFLILHGWEWLVLWGVAAGMTDWNPWVTGILIGYWQHLVFDQLGNKSSMWGYSLLLRWKNGFDLEAAFPKGNQTKKDR